MNSSIMTGAIKEIVKRCAAPVFCLFRYLDKLISKDCGSKKVLLFAVKGAIAAHLAEFAETIAPLMNGAVFYCIIDDTERTQYEAVFDKIQVKYLSSRWRAYTKYFDLIVTGHLYNSRFKDKSTKVIDINHGGHIIGVDNGNNTVFYSQMLKNCPDIVLEANRYKAEAVCRDYPEFGRGVKWVGWKFAEKELLAVNNRDNIRNEFGFKDNDVVLFIVGTWGPYSLYHTYGDCIFDVIRNLSGKYKIVVSAHYNDYRATQYHNGVDALPKGRMVDELVQCGCIVRKFNEPWIEYMAAADVVFTDYSTLSEEAVAMGKKVIFSNYPDTAVWKHSICYRARKHMPVVEDINRLDEYVEDALKMEIPEEVRKMADETFVSRKDYEEKVLGYINGLLELK